MQCVLVGISGGVDSAVAAYLLQKQGYHVEGLYIVNGFPTRSEENAVHVCKLLEIPFHRLDITKPFNLEIVDYFVSEYCSARTPNPCIVCNKKIKFKYLLSEADRMNINFVATGHYARIENPAKDKGFSLMKGVDSKKDQSYFLFLLEQQELARIIFPNGGLAKSDVKKIGAELGLGTIVGRESQEICFIPDDNYRNFIKMTDRYAWFRPGNIVDTKGTIVGKHYGIHSLTIGQRKGLNIASKRPYYVLQINKERNEIIVGREEEQYSEGLIAEGVSWISPNFATQNHIKARAHIRYRHRGVDSEITILSGNTHRIHVRFDTPVKAVTPGQAVVFYQNDNLIGGGWIEAGVHYA